MEEKSRTRFAILIALILAAAVIYSFTFNLFEKTPSVGLSSGGGTPGVGDEIPIQSGNVAVQVEVTPETVQSVIETLTRYRSYSRTIQIEYLRGGETEGALSAVVAEENGWTRVDLTSPGGVEHTIVGDEICYRWYDNDREYVQLPAGEVSDDLAQRIPTYENVLQLDKKHITAAGYESRGGVACIYVETAEDELGYLERYWVSVESGLLVSAETVKSDEVVYRMTAYQVESPLANQDGRFVLPDGTVLSQSDED